MIRHGAAMQDCVLMQMNDDEGSGSSEQESEGRADSGQSAVGSSPAHMLHNMLLHGPYCPQSAHR